MMEFVVLTPEEVEALKDDWVSLPWDDADHEHDWRRIWSTNGSGLAWQCEICWDRTD